MSGLSLTLAQIFMILFPVLGIIMIYADKRRPTNYYLGGTFSLLGISVSGTTLGWIFVIFGIVLMFIMLSPS